MSTKKETRSKKSKQKEDFFFDDCAVCRFEKARQEGRLMPGTSEMEGLKKAFREAKEKGAIVWSRDDENPC